MSELNRNRGLILAFALLLGGAAIGYIAAKLTSDHSEPAKGTEAAQQPSGQDSLVVPASSLQMMGITTETAAAGDLAAEVQAPGVVAAAPNAQAIVTARAAGTVTRVNKRLGDAVKAGEVIALVASREAAAFAAELRTAESKLELARSILKREQSLYEQKVTPRQDFEAAQAQWAAAQAEADRARSAAAAAGVASDGQSLAVSSPITGRITSANAALGAYVEANTELFRVADPRFISVEVAVPAIDSKRIAVGNRADITTGSGIHLKATVSTMTPTLNEQTRAATVLLALDSHDAALTPGEFVQARILTKAQGTAVTVPEEAVQNVNGHDAVFVRTDKGFKVTPVAVGARSGGRAAIVSGLRAEDVVAAKNAFLLKAEIGKSAGEEE